MSHEAVIADLSAEAGSFEDLLTGLSDEDWAKVTPAVGWTVAHQVGHLTFVYRIAALAASDPEKFTAMTSTIGERGGFDAVVSATAAEHLAEGPAALLGHWQAARKAAVGALAAVPTESTVPWLVNPLPPTVLCAAGMMEAFAHGQDIADALGIRRERTDRLRRIVDFVALTWQFGYESNGLTPPAKPFRFEVSGPSGETWYAGAGDAETGLITGPAEDLVLLATRRRHRDDLDLKGDTAAAEEWLGIAQAYRGPKGAGRAPGQFQH
ncbi:TIGR03084 family protein [Amycolatopsis thailandensis]|uniref:TIGR03084 family protein n=1 Tax=Amycolatopsis thailandensis TaxID=589330 RepID=A0A229S3G6_9PSEU|nr:TIGR03084 family metal-binding protein [Amycolatopsis thailandensis]OXM53134.1 TIGR03084 family protein [Amycolatopsis thailandensis]